MKRGEHKQEGAINLFVRDQDMDKEEKEKIKKDNMEKVNRFKAKRIIKMG
jgi:hypothetical protein